MSCNIYEDPDRNLKVKYSRGAREEKEVDIYESSDYFIGSHAGPSMQHEGAQTKRHQDFQSIKCRNAALILGILCFLLFVGICVLLYLMISKQDANNNKNITSQSNQSCSSCQLEEGNQAGGQWFKPPCFYTSTEKKNWTESRSDCLRRGGDLVVIENKQKHDLIKVMLVEESWIGLAVNSKENKWKWVDGSEPRYWAWGKGVSVLIEAELKAFTKRDGIWNKTQNGLKHWICEKTC